MMSSHFKVYFSLTSYIFYVKKCDDHQDDQLFLIIEQLIERVNNFLDEFILN